MNRKVGLQSGREGREQSEQKGGLLNRKVGYSLKRKLV